MCAKEITWRNDWTGAVGWKARMYTEKYVIMIQNNWRLIIYVECEIV